MRQISYCEALNEAMYQEMERDPTVFVYGIGVPDHKKIFGSTNRLLEKFGKERCFDTPLSEDSMMGFGLGAAICGLRPINVHIRVDFLMLAMNQLVNMISTYNYSTLGRIGVPLVIRAIIGRGWGQGYQHSKSLQSFFAHIPGLKVIMPVTPFEAKGLLTAAIRDNNPVICLEHRWLYWIEDYVNEEPYLLTIGPSSCLKNGKDITILATSWMNIEAIRAANILKNHGIQVEVINAKSIAPFFDSQLCESVSRTKHLIIADNDWINCGFAAEVATRVNENCFGELKKPINRIGFANTHCPTVRCLEDEFYPNAVTIVRAIEKQLDLDPIDLSREEMYSHEMKFRGPF